MLFESFIFLDSQDQSVHIICPNNILNINKNYFLIHKNSLIGIDCTVLQNKLRRAAVGLSVERVLV